MKGYSRNKEDFREVLINKYTVMDEAIFIEWEDCSKCLMLKPHVQKRAEENWYKFEAYKFNEIKIDFYEIKSVPMLFLKGKNFMRIFNEEWIVNLISNQNKNGGD